MKNISDCIFFTSMKMFWKFLFKKYFVYKIFVFIWKSISSNVCNISIHIKSGIIVCCNRYYFCIYTCKCKLFLLMLSLFKSITLHFTYTQSFQSCIIFSPMYFFFLNFFNNRFNQEWNKTHHTPRHAYNPDKRTGSLTTRHIHTAPFMRRPASSGALVCEIGKLSN